MKNYGLPYKGSKNRLADKICACFPKRTNFYDLFCGGCAITHCAMIHNQFSRYIINDICQIPVKLFSNAVQGKFNNEKRWISHEEFNRIKSFDEYAACCFSFGNNFRDYCYPPRIEPYKKSAHYAILFDDWDLIKNLFPEVWQAAFDALYGISDTKERRLAFGHSIIRRLKELGAFGVSHCFSLERIQSLESLERIQSLERIERIQSLERLERIQSLESYVLDYRDVPILSDSVIYCDIPYQGSENYFKNKFDYEAFFAWCAKQTEPVFVSSYELPPDKFDCIAEFKHLCSIRKDKTYAVVERLFIPIHQKRVKK